MPLRHRRGPSSLPPLLLLAAVAASSSWFSRGGGPPLFAAADSCFSLSSCTDCVRTTTCHWCGHKNGGAGECHVEGSPSGCVRGSACSAPTAAPTPAPTGAPTRTEAPTSAPTTAHPTAAPTARPTAVPTTPPPPAVPTSAPPKSCFGQPNCPACYGAGRTCHWCAHDNACHAKGSKSGCLEGKTCAPDPSSLPPSPSPTAADHSCFAQTSCRSCYADGATCHWCGKKGECHTKGSTGGCAAGSSCNATDHSCFAQPSCETCYADGATCHWCGGKGDAGECHTKGSTGGCAVGTSCDACAGQETCNQCTAAGRTCHWCAHDSACHTVGSVHGCLSGVNCRENKKCMREGPEHISKLFTPLSFGAACVIILFGTTVLLCSTGCIFLADSMRGAFNDLVHSQRAVHAAAAQTFYYDDDLALEPMDDDDDEGLLGHHRVDDRSAMQMSLLTAGGGNATAEGVPVVGPPIDMFGQGGGARSDQQYTLLPEGTGDEEDILPQGTGDGEDLPGQALATYSAAEDDGESETGAGDYPLVPSDQMSLLGAQGAESVLLTPSSNNRLMLASALAGPMVRHGPGPPPRSHADKAYRTIRLFYWASFACTILVVFTTVAFFPRVPDYNFCGDDVDWQSIIDSMATMSVRTSFQLLASVYNPNHANIHVTGGTGTFSHEGVMVGTLTLPDTTARRSAVTDVLVTATFTPDKWEAAGLIAEYYQGNLKFVVDAVGSVEVPLLRGYTFRQEFRDMLINVNRFAENDRHLCLCP